jgi:P4 family phage/plasmid primase-like protien
MSTSNIVFDQHELSRFLSQRRTKVGQTASMTGMGSLKGKWLITDADYPRFYELLHDYLFVKRGRPMGFVEQPRKGEPKPLLIDLDFKYPVETSLVRAFNLDQIKDFCKGLTDCLGTFFSLDEYEALRFFVTLRPAPYTSGGLKKDGVHILCPDISLSDEKQKAVRNWMLANDAIRSCFADTGFIDNETEGPEKIYDESMVRKQGWILFGESKPNIPPYALEAVFKYEPAAATWSEEARTDYSAIELMELLSVRYGLVEDVNEVREDAREQYTEALRWGAAPQQSFAAGGGGGAAAADPEEGAATATAAEGTGGNAILEALQAIYPGEQTDEDKKMIRRFVMECLGPSYFSDYDKWIRVGWCLHNIDPSEENFQLWMDFSARSTKSSGNNSVQLRRDWFNGWRKEGDGPRLTERSLRKWAKDENPEKYKEIMSEYIGTYVREQLEPTHYHIAKLMRKMYGSTYIASVTSKTTEWYKYDDEQNMWKKVTQGMELRMKICTEVAQTITESTTKLIADAAKATKQDTRDFLQTKAKALLKVATALYSSGFNDSTMKMATQEFYEEEFHNKLNINPYLFGCRNGMLELRVAGEDGRDHVVFRPGRPEDYVSFLAGQNHPETAAIDYVPYDAADPRQAEIADFFSKLFPDAELRRYTLRLLASCLEGANKEQCFYIATGGGGNGKSKLVELMRLTLGDYQTSLQSTVMTRKRPEAGAANPEIMAAKCRRFIYLQEPDDKEPINTSRMKQFSGEDMVEARALYGDQEKFMIMGKLFMMCNRLPPVTTMDRGTWRRIRVIEFVSKFVLPDHPEYLARRPNVFLIDPALDRKLREWREPFLSLLVHIYENEYIPFGLNPIPASVTKASSNYRESFDVYSRFKSERIREPRTTDEKMECVNNPVTVNRIKTVLAAWKRDTRSELTWQDAVNRLTEEYGEPRGGKEWGVFRVFSSDDEAIEWDKSGEAATS